MTINELLTNDYDYGSSASERALPHATLEGLDLVRHQINEGDFSGASDYMRNGKILADLPGEQHAELARQGKALLATPEGQEIAGRIGFNPRQKMSAFTLIELLVVIGITALLVGILMPALGKARHEARATLDASNMRQMTTAQAVYAADNDGAIPYTNIANGPGENGMYIDGLGYGAMAELAKNMNGGSLSSPAANSIWWSVERDDPTDPFAGNGQYGYEALATSNPVQLNSFTSKKIRGQTDSIPIPDRMSLVREPSRNFEFVQGDEDLGDRVILGYFDGHASSLGDSPALDFSTLDIFGSYDTSIQTLLDNQ